MKTTTWSVLSALFAWLAVPLAASAQTALYNVQLNGYTNSAYSGAAMIGQTGDLWNAPNWAGLYTGSTVLFTNVTVLDSAGSDQGVTLTMTAAYDNNTSGWNSGVFKNYTGQTAGAATPGLMDRLVKVDYSGTVNVMTLVFSGLPASTPVTAYVYGAGNGAGQGGLWTLAAANGGASATIGYDGSATGRNVTLASSKGTGWQNLAGTSDATGKFTVTATGTHANSVWWQTYLNGIQLQVGAAAPVIYSLTNQTAEANSTVRLSPIITGNPAPTCQWLENGVNLAGQTNAVLTLTNVATGQNGHVYTLIADNAAGAVTNNMTLTVNAPVYSTMTVTATSPANGVGGVCVDTPLTATFSDTVTLGLTGSIEIFNATNPATPVDAISVAAGLTQARTFPGDGQSFTYRTIQVNGNTVTIYPHFNVLAANQTYYVTLDPGTFKDSGGDSFAGLLDTNAWRFTTGPAPADFDHPVVDAGGHGDFLTVQGAVNSLASGAAATPRVISIRNGFYNEIVDVSGRDNILLRGQSRAGVVISFPNNAAFQTANGGTTHARMNFKVNADDIALDSLTISNSTPQGGSQAEALTIDVGAQRCVVNNCEIDSRQDTLLASVNSSQAYFRNCTIRGNYDYIWGGGNLYFDQCLFDTVGGVSSGNLTAARTTTGVTQGADYPWANPGGTYTANGVSFVNCTFTADPGVVSVTLAGANGTAGNNVSWYGCAFATNYAAPSASLFSGNYVFWQAQNTQAGAPVTFANITSLSGNDARLLAATNLPTWFYGWQPQLAPVITVPPPASVTNTAGETAALTVAADGLPAPVYQWLRDGTNAPFPSANAATLTIPNVQPGDAGTYSVVVSNAAGQAVSSNTTLTVIVPTAPALAGAAQISGGGEMQFSFTGTADAAYRVWASTNLTLLPVIGGWDLVGGGNFGVAPAVFADSQTTNFPQRFYIITSP